MIRGITTKKKSFTKRKRIELDVLPVVACCTAYGFLERKVGIFVKKRYLLSDVSLFVMIF